MATIFEKVSVLQERISAYRIQGTSVGFVPTMGALHEGHLSLVRQSMQENDHTVVSIFVNPTQFNDKNDLLHYPRTIAQDLAQLDTVGSTDVFIPDVQEIYPNGTEKDGAPDLGGLDITMEGASRPGHFKGMAQVVRRLLDIVTPNRLYMGQKDFQQFTIVQYMIQKHRLPVQLVRCPIVRESGGLAMSSRNVRLSTAVRTRAALIFEVLNEIKERSGVMDVASLESYALRRLSIAPFEPEYFSIVDGSTLGLVENIDQTAFVVACAAVRAEGVRLIDNIIIKEVV
jgi:pantoate--beta-alanine ligase